MEFSLDTFVISLINIAVTFVILRKLVYKPVFVYLKQRSEKIESDLKKAAESVSAAAEEQRRLDSELRAAKQKADEIIKESSEDARAASEILIASAGTEAKRLLAEAKTEAEKAKETAMINLQSEISVIASDIARRILIREIDCTDNENIVREYFAEVKNNA